MVAAVPDIEAELFPQRCGQAACHNSTTTRPPCSIWSARGWRSALVNVPATSDCNGAPLVVPNAPETSVLYTKLTSLVLRP